MPTDALSQVYARSLFELAESAGGREKIQEVASELEQIAELARSDRGLREFLASPLIDPVRRGASLRRIFEGRVSDLTMRFLLVLNEKGRLRRFDSIVETFDHLEQEAFGRIEVDLFTAAPLGSAQLADIKARVQKVLRHEPVMHPYTDPAMIGGIKLRIGDQLVDGSIATQLRRMKHALLSSGGAAIRERLSRFIDEKPGTAEKR
jgi:F-type H+-transporting ATPase subunit delta